MKNHAMKILLAGLLTAVLPLSGCIGIGPNGAITGSGHAVTRDYDIAGFDSIDVGSSFETEISHSNTFKVSITADDNLFDNIVVEKQGSTLNIATKSLSFLGRPTLKAFVSLPDLKNLSVSGAATPPSPALQRRATYHAICPGRALSPGNSQQPGKSTSMPPERPNAR